MRRSPFLLVFGLLAAPIFSAMAQSSDAMGQSAMQSHVMQPITGTFQGADGHSAGGGYTLSQDGNRATLTFADDFQVQKGPDVYVVLSASATPSRSTDLYLAKIQKFKGGQTYQVPAGVDLTKYRYVVLWCEQYHVPMGRAALARPVRDTK